MERKNLEDLDNIIKMKVPFANIEEEDLEIVVFV